MDLTVIDVGSMVWSIESGKTSNTTHVGNGKGIKTGAADVARLLESLESLHPGKLGPAEVQQLSDEFARVYGAGYHVPDAVAYEKAERWYRVELELAVLKKPDATAKARIFHLLGMEPTL
jgi:hypothetical protein